MKFNDDITKSIAATVSRVLEGKAPLKKEEVKYPHDMYHPKTGEKEVAKDEADHKALSAKGYTHEKPKVNEVEEPNKPSGKLGQDSGERDFKAKHPIKKVGVKTDLDGTTMNEESEVSKEESEKQKKYQAFFNKALKKFGVSSPAELEGDKKKEFFDYVDANYEGDDEVDESVEEATLSVSAYTGNMKPAKIKLKKGKANSYGGHDVTAIGNEKDLIAWAVRSLGVVKPKNFRDAQKQIDDMS